MAVATDGRVIRGIETRRLILVAARAIIERTSKPPIAKEVAQESGVSLRTIYHHFPDVETLTREALALKPKRKLVITILPAE